MTSGRTGVLGGTFDPIHLGHHDVAMAARAALSLDRVLFIPSRRPPHRTEAPGATATDRLTMVRLAVEDDAGFDASDLEFQSTGPSFTSHTLSRLADKIAPCRMFFITGADAFADIATWHDYPDLLDQSHFVVVSRPGYPVAALGRVLPDLTWRMEQLSNASPRLDHPEGTRIWLVDADTRDVSSSDIRTRLTTGLPIDGLVHSSVTAYITRHGLYGATSDTSLHA